MRIKITVDTDDTADLLALKALAEHYLSQPAPDYGDEVEQRDYEDSRRALGRIGRVLEKALGASEKVMKTNLDQAIYGDGCRVPFGMESVQQSLTRDWDRYR